MADRGTFAKPRTMTKRGAARLFAVAFSVVTALCTWTLFTTADDVTRAGSAIVGAIAAVAASAKNTEAKNSRKRHRK